MKRIGENPPARFPENARIDEAASPWWIAKVKPRQEKALAFDCIKNNIEYYLPLITKVTRRKDNNKPRKSILPLFAGYISFCAPAGKQNLLYATDRVVSILEIKNQRHFIEEISQIYRALSSNMPLEPALVYAPGTLVRVQSGPLAGISGVITRVQNIDKLILSVKGLGQAAMVIDAANVKEVPQP
jgi:transcription termination/antitermination protein NusG